MNITPARPLSIPDDWTTLTALMPYSRYDAFTAHIKKNIPDQAWSFASLAAVTWTEDGRDCLTVRFKGYFANAMDAFELKMCFG